jgi:hypothetical protein
MSISTVVSSRTLTPLARPASITAALLSHPPRGVGVPLVTRRSDASSSRQEAVPALLRHEGRRHRLTDELAAPPGSGAAVDLGHEAVLQLYVHSHVLKLAHTAPPTAELDRDSVVNLTQLLTLDKDDLDTRVGRLPLPLVREIDEGLRQVLEL